MSNRNTEGNKHKEWGSLIAWIAAASLCLVASFQLIKKSGSAGENSWFPMSQALDLLHQSPGATVYETLFFSGHIKFQYPPTGLLVLELSRWLGVTTSSALNLANAWLLILSGLAFSVFAVKILGTLRWFGYRLPIGPIAFLLAVAFYPNRLALQFGQIQILLGLLFLLSCLAQLDNKYIFAGEIIAGAATVKPQFLLFGLLMVWQREWRFVVGFVIVTSIALFLSIELYGLRSHIEYFKVLRFLSQHGEYHHLNQSINGILNRYLYDGPSVDVDPENPVPNSGFPSFLPIVYVASTLTSLALVAIAFWVRRLGADPVLKLLGFCTAAILFTMASPVAWVHHYNVLLPGYVVALKVILDRKGGERAWPLALIVISFLLTGLPLATPFGPTVPSLNLFQSHVFIGAVLLVAVLLLELSSRPQPNSDTSSMTSFRKSDPNK